MKTRAGQQRLHLALSTALLSAVSLMVTSATRAHHSFAAFEEVRIRTLEGTVETFQWTNPHVMLRVLTNLDGGRQPREWTIVTSGPAILRRFGWRGDSIKAGDRVRVACNPLRDGSPGCRLHTLTVLGAGRTLKTKLSTSSDLNPT